MIYSTSGLAARILRQEQLIRSGGEGPRREGSHKKERESAERAAFPHTDIEVIVDDDTYANGDPIIRGAPWPTFLIAGEV